MRTLAILPAKGTPRAKQRLSKELEPGLRRALAEAMLEDVLEALGGTKSLEMVLLVTPALARSARELAGRYGAQVLTDSEQGHNQAAAVGIARAAELGAERVLLVPGDCPALDPAEIDALLDSQPAGPGVVIVPDRHGTGTNALLLAPPAAMAPSFGPGSCARHAERAAALGLEGRVVEVASLALDVDTAEDLDALAQAGGGRAPRTLALLARC